MNEKYIIGLTGNIGTGKSVVRNMLEHLGAMGIDADGLSHRAIARDSQGYHQVIETFGKDILDERQIINRASLGQLVFSDSVRLKQLEGIIHPLIHHYLENILHTASQKVIVIEAIKILETDLRQYCNRIWVTTATPNKQLERMMSYRNMNERDARLRINAQNSADKKIAQADFIIDNRSNFTDLWQQVLSGWHELSSHVRIKEQMIGETQISNVLTGNPSMADEIGVFFNAMHQKPLPEVKEEIMAMLARQKINILKIDQEIIGSISWKILDFITFVQDILLSPEIDEIGAFNALLSAVEEESRQRLCECIMVNMKNTPEFFINRLISMGYRLSSVHDLPSTGWQENTISSLGEKPIVYFKPLINQKQIFDL